MNIGVEERLDEIGFGDLKIIQHPLEFCYGVDAVIAADFAARLPIARLRILAEKIAGSALAFCIGSLSLAGSQVTTSTFEKKAAAAAASFLRMTDRILGRNILERYL